MTFSANGFPFLASDEQNPDVVFNQLALRADAAVGPVVDRTLTSPPGSPSQDGVYIPSSAAIGPWVGQENNIAKYDGSAWTFYTPKNGWTYYSLGDASFILFNGTTWGII